MIGLYRDPHGEKIFKSVSSSTAREASNTASNLRKKVAELERELTQVGLMTESCTCCVIVPQVTY